MHKANSAIVLRGAWRRVVLRRKSGDLVEVVAMLQCIDVAGIYLFMCLEVCLGIQDHWKYGFTVFLQLEGALNEAK